MTSPDGRILDAEHVLDRVESLCRQAIPRLPAKAAKHVGSAAEGLTKPLCIAFVGRVSSGKSTLVNAFLRRRVAPTGEGECTKIVTWFRFGTTNRAMIRKFDGQVLPLRLERGGVLPSQLDVDLKDIRAIEIELSLESLRHTTVIDTPGLNSINRDNSSQTTQFLEIDRVNPESEGTAETPDVILFVLTGPVQEDEKEILLQFRSVSTGLYAPQSNVIGILTKADQMTIRIEDSWKRSSEIGG